jgi:hypothetical protein
MPESLSGAGLYTNHRIENRSVHSRVIAAGRLSFQQSESVASKALQIASPLKQSSATCGSCISSWTVLDTCDGN